MIKQLITLTMMLTTLPCCLEAQQLNSAQSDPTLQRGTASLCQPMTTRDLELQLETSGGFNKRYQAIKKADAAKFPNLVNPRAVSKVPARHTKKSRGKRQANSFPQTNVTSVSTRGSLDQHGFHRLCTELSAVTRLSADYFPRFLNEVICDTVDNGCLSYEGVCFQGSFVVDVLMNTGLCGSDGKEIWKAVSYPIRSCCNCRLFQGSILSSYL